MRITRLSDNLMQVERLRFVNAYLVREDDGLTLIDTTVPGATEDLLTAASEMGGEIRRIAVTHVHSDHIGSLDVLKERLGATVQVLIPEIDMNVLDGERSWEGRKVKGSFSDVRTRPDATLKPGDDVGSLHVLGSPGHTPGHVAYLDSRDRSLIAGDVFKTLGGTAVTSHFTLPFPLPYLATWYPLRDVESAEALSDQEPTLLAVGHGQALRDPAGEMRAAVARARESLR
jgi:glyoxylase-like metal-dependent hydrolase (beta-lactamase superfamily II)